VCRVKPGRGLERIVLERIEELRTQQSTWGVDGGNEGATPCRFGRGGDRQLNVLTDINGEKQKQNC